MKKITLATIKKFIRENRDNLLIKNISEFSGMTDGIEFSRDQSFRPAVKPIPDWNAKNMLDIQYAWFVGGSRDSFNRYDDNQHTGFEVYNCCGHFVLAVTK
jgi:hypothetical protein